MATNLTTTKTDRPKFSGGCALKIRTYDVTFKDGSRALIRADVRVAARLIGSGHECAHIHVRGY